MQSLFLTRRPFESKLADLASLVGTKAQVLQRMQGGHAPPRRADAVAAGPVAGGSGSNKRQRTEGRASQPLAGVTIYVPSKLPHCTQIFKLWSKSVPSLGGAVTQDAACTALTHVIVPSAAPQVGKSGGGSGGGAAAGSSRSGWGSLPERLRPGAAAAPADAIYVTQAWLTDSLRYQRRQAEAEYRPPPPPAAAGAGAGAAVAGPAGGSVRSSWDGDGSDDEDGVDRAGLEAWLGPLYSPECAEMDQLELALQGDYDEERCRRIGNEPVVQALRELQKYEVALNGQWLENAQGKKVSNHKSLAYARAAAAVRTCAYRLKPPVAPGQLPFLAKNTAEEVTEILETGTSLKLEAFRRNQPVRDSKGVLRADSAGAAARRAFVKLPGVGASYARRWWEQGLRTFEDLEAAAAQGSAGGKPLRLTEQHRFSLKHRADLLEGTTSEDVAEMAAALTAALERVSGTAGWQIELVGGSRRKRPASAAAAGASQAAAGGESAGAGGSEGGGGGGGGSQQQQPGAVAGGLQAEQQQMQQQPGAGTAGLHGGVLGSSGGQSGCGSFIGSIVAGQHHDADFMVSHPTYSWDEGLIEQLRDELVLRRRMVPPEVAGSFSMMQKGRTKDLESKLLQELTRSAADGDETLFSNIQNDSLAVLMGQSHPGKQYRFSNFRLDHLLGVFRTLAGKLRRIDIIMSTPSQMPYAEIGWIGSQQWNRFVRGHVGRCGMHLNSHGLYRIKNGKICRVPDDAPPLDRHGREYWPQGWGPGSSSSSDGSGDVSGITPRVTSDVAMGAGAAGQGAKVAGGGGPTGTATGRPTAVAAGAVAAETAEAVGAAAAAAPHAHAAAAVAGSAGGSRRVVRTQRDVFELLGLPWREPYQRDCP